MLPRASLSRQQRLPLVPRGAPLPSTPVRGLTRPCVPAGTPSRPMPLKPETDDGR